MKKDSLYHAIHINVEKCIACSHCVKVCPTEALHIWDGHSNLDPERCIDCDECYRVCPVGAIQVEDDGLSQIENFTTKVALIPSVFMGQFPIHVKAREVFKAIQTLGFTYVYEVEEGSQLVEELFKEKIDSNEKSPYISSFCPAVLRLIQVNFPQFTDNIINLKTPVDITATSVRKQLELKNKENIGVFYFTPCSAKITSLKAPIGEEESELDGVINMDSVFNKIQAILNNQIFIHKKNKKEISNNAIQPDHILWSLTGGEIKNLQGTCLSIDGIKNIISFLDRIETRGCHEIDFLEMKGCDQGCAGGILTPQNRFITAQRLRNRAKYYSDFYSENPDKSPIHHTDGISFDEVKTNEIKPRSIVKFDSDPMKALLKMQKTQEISRKLPSLDCVACGYPTCKSLTRNIIEGNAELEYCFIYQRKAEEKGDLTPEKSKEVLEHIWGERKFKQ
ncbi:MAG: 4Fe-4S binding protein [Flavobacteriales bacterium]|nr:4Fe-4S binding protein [Flavobacteriales bacterium]